MKSCVILAVFIFVISAADGGSIRISNGQPTTISQHPFSTSLLTGLGVGPFVQQCGGTILTSSAILSAASCFHTGGIADPPARWRARVGSTYSTWGGTIHLIRLITRHPEFNHNTLQNDIAVLRATISMTLVPGLVQAAFIAGATYQLADREPVTAIGWGATSPTVTSSNVLRQVQMSTIDQATCAERYSPEVLTVTSSMICAGWLDVGTTGQCQGDTGSPLLHNDVVVGVYSWTEGCGVSRFPNINTRVSVFSRWIVSTAIAA